MINPLDTPSYFSVYVQASAIEELFGDLMPCDDLETALITSSDFGTDIESTASCLDFLKRFDANPTLKLNPMYSPTHGDLYDVIEFDQHGEFLKIEGFKSPYVYATLVAEKEDAPVEATVQFREFDLPTLEECLNHKIQLS